MTKANPLPDLVYLQACFAYDPESGVLAWLERPLAHFANVSRWKAINKKFAGKTAGRAEPPDFYVRVKLCGTKFHGARIIFKLMTGEDPENLVDHKDLDRSNNRWLNLRPATYSDNLHNTRMYSSNTSGYKGVYYSLQNGKWGAAICLSMKTRFLGYHDTPELAFAAYSEAAKRLHGEFARTE